ncbi:MAG: GTP pyrophosphokinase family protein [Ruminiclostridium sp.]
MINTEKNQKIRNTDEIRNYFDSNGLTEALSDISADIISRIEQLEKKLSDRAGRPIVDNIISRIKSPESIARKLVRKNRNVTPRNALTTLHDLIGIRVVCPFQDDVFLMAEEISKDIGFEVVNIKDFVSKPKSSGYRSIHIILACKDACGRQLFAEIQVRSVAMNYWAILEHQLCYKSEDDRVRALQEQLKECAKEIAAIDIKFYKLRRKIERLK